tara:strand:- start:128 stop:301 length:174 start_codon:yes stop_codon:yes gene_type:complete
MLNAAQTLNNVEDLDSMYNEDFDISWDENDIIQAPEDDWVAAILGSETEVIDELIHE